MPKITKRLIDAAKPAGKDYFVWDDALPGFGIRVYPSGRVFYILQFKRGARTNRLSLGQHGPITAAQARDKAIAALSALGEGRNPADERREARQGDTGPSESYREAVEDFVEKYHRARKGNSTWRESRRLLLKHGVDWLDRPVRNIAKADVLKVLDGLMAAGTPYLANRVCAAMRTFFGWSNDRDKTGLHVRSHLNLHVGKALLLHLLLEFFQLDLVPRAGLFHLGRATLAVRLRIEQAV